MVYRNLLLIAACATCALAQDTTPPPVKPPATPAAAIDPDANAVPAFDWHDRMKLYFTDLVGVPALEVAPEAAYDQLRKFPHEWGVGKKAFAHRLESNYAQFFLAETIELGIASLHKEDPRYFRVGPGGGFKRTLHALESAVVAQSLQGGQTIALGKIAGAYGSWAIASQVWEPPSEQSFGHVMLWGSVNLGVVAGGNLLREFWPDVKKMLIGH